MDERAKQPDTPKTGDTAAADAGHPSIPDGGLSETMPAWLQRPPAWRGMTVREPERRDLPPPDTSVIDPRTMLDLGDLPLWLQRIAARSGELERVQTDESEPAASSEPAATLEPDPEPPERLAPDAPGAAPVQPPHDPERPPPEIAFIPATRDQRTAWWRSRAALAGLAVFIVFVVVWVVLVAT